MGMGYEYVESLPLVEEAPSRRRGSGRDAQGQAGAAGQKTLILHPTNLWLTIHESVGHPTELDRALGYEANFAGTSFLTTDKLGQVPVRVEAGQHRRRQDAGEGMATCGYDDDGVKTTRFPIIKDGMFVDYQTTREQAHLIGQKASHGCSYADNWSSVPFQRMPNVSLQPGDKEVTRAGHHRARPRMASSSRVTAATAIDHQRYNFQFSGQTFWEVKNGKITTQLRDSPISRTRRSSGNRSTCSAGKRPTCWVARSATARVSRYRATRSATAVRSRGFRR